MDPCTAWPELARTSRAAKDRGERWREIVVKYLACNTGVLDELVLYPDREHAEKRAEELMGFAISYGFEIPNDQFADKIRDTADQLAALAAKKEKPVTPPPRKNIDRKADPVSMWDGQLIYDVEDLRLRGAGVDFAFRRTHRNQAPYVGPLGHRWDHTYNVWLRVSGEHAVLSTGDLATRDYLRHPRFGDPGFDYWMPPDGDDAVLLEEGDSFVQRRPDGTRLIFEIDPSMSGFLHRLARVEDRHGNFLRLTHEARGVARVDVNRSDRFVVFDYDDEGRVITLADHTGRRWRYEYDDLGDLTAVILPTGDAVFYEYNSSYASVGQQHALVHVTDPLGRIFLDIAYGDEPGLPEQGRVVKQRQGGGEYLFSYADLTSEPLENDDGGIAFGGPTTPVRATTLVSRNGHEQMHIYNAAGNLLSMRETALVGGRMRHLVWQYAYNADGAMVASRSPEGAVTQCLFGREEFLRRHDLDDAAAPEAIALMTRGERQGFGRLLTCVRRGRPPAAASTAVFRDIRDVDPEDVIEKTTYEPVFGQIATRSDPRFTSRADGASAEHPLYDATLTRWIYDGPLALLAEVHRPTPENPDGTPAGPVVERFLEYDDRGRVRRHQDEAGLVTETVRFGATDDVREGFVRRVVRDPGGAAEVATEYEVDDLGRVIAVVHPRGVETGDGRFAERTAYDALDRPVATTASPPFLYQTRRRYDPAGMLAREERDAVDANGAALPGGPQVRTWEHDEDLLLVSETFGGADKDGRARTRHRYDAFGARILTLLPRGNRTRFRYDRRGLPVAQIQGYGAPEACRRTAKFDGDRRAVRQVDGRGFTTTTTYDVLGRAVAVEDPLGNVVRQTYSKTGRLLVERVFERRGATDDYVLLARSERRYDALDRLIAETTNRFEDPPPASDLAVDFAEGPGPGVPIVWQTFYDAGSRVVRRVDLSRGVENSVQYDRLGRVAVEIDGAGNRAVYGYDANDNPIRCDRHERESGGGGGSGERVFSWEATYDELDRLVARTDGLGNTARFAYDSLGRLVRTTDPLGNVRDAEHDLQGRLTADALSRTATGLGGGAPLPPAITRYAYDANGNLTAVTDALGRQTRYEVDALDRRVARVDPALGRTAYAYDRDGHLVGVALPSGRRLARTVDSHGRVLRVDADGAPGPGATFERYEYDGLGRPVVEENDHLRVEIRRDSLGLAVDERQTFTLPAAGLPAALHLARRFDTAGRLIELVYPDGRRVGYARDALGALTAVTNVATGTAYPGASGGADPRPLVARIDYLGRRRRALELGNGARVAYRYDGVGRILEIAHGGPAGALLTLQHLYDGASNVRLRNELPAGSSPRRGELFGYDSLRQLVRDRARADLPVLGLDVDPAPFGPPAAPLPSPLPLRQSQIDAVIAPLVLPGDQDFTYDTVGNRVTERDVDGGGATITTIVGDLDQVTEVGGVGAAHDADGNLTALGARLFSYDAWGRLVGVDEPGDEPLRFFHDARGRRIAETAGATTMALLHDDDRLIEEYRGGMLLSQLVNDDGLDRPVQIATGGQDLWYHADLQGSIRLLTDGAGVARAHYGYSPFGRPQAHPAVPRNPLRYAARRLDAAIESYDFRARQYDPRLGRFLQRDPTAESGPTVQVFAYAGNNPLAFNDPTGATRKEVVKGDPSKKSPRDKGRADMSKAVATPAPPAQTPAPAPAPTPEPGHWEAFRGSRLSEEERQVLVMQFQAYTRVLSQMHTQDVDLWDRLAQTKSELFRETHPVWPNVGTLGTTLHWGKKIVGCYLGPWWCAAEIGSGVIGEFDHDAGRVVSYGIAIAHGAPHGWEHVVEAVGKEAAVDVTATGLHHHQEHVEKEKKSRADQLRGEIREIEIGRATLKSQIETAQQLRDQTLKTLTDDAHQSIKVRVTADGAYEL